MRNGTRPHNLSRLRAAEAQLIEILERTTTGEMELPEAIASLYAVAQDVYSTAAATHPAAPGGGSPGGAVPPVFLSPLAERFPRQIFNPKK